MVQEQGRHGRERECRRWSGTVKGLPAPAQAAECPAEQSLHPANAKGDYSGLQNEQTKAIYTYLQHPPPVTSSLQTRARAQGGTWPPRAACREQSPGWRRQSSA